MEANGRPVQWMVNDTALPAGATTGGKFVVT